MPRACACEWQTGIVSQMLTYSLFNTRSMLLSATSRKQKLDVDLHPVQSPNHAVVRKKHAGPARCWLTSCSKASACSDQKQAQRTSQMQTYILCKIKSMLFSATSRNGQPDAGLHTVQNPVHDLVSNKQEVATRCQHTSYLKSRAWLCEWQAERASQMLTYILFKSQCMLLSEIRTKGQSDANLHPVQNQEYALISNQHKMPARWWLTSCSNPRACSCQ